jgi:hypothetical protein
MPKINETIQKIQQGLSDSKFVNSLKEDIPFLEKALSSYELDIQKAQDIGHEYYLSLVGDLASVKNDLDLIKIAKSKINQFE